MLNDWRAPVPWASPRALGDSKSGSPFRSISRFPSIEKHPVREQFVTSLHAEGPSIRVNGKTQTWHLGQSDLQSFALLPLSAPTNLRSDPLWLLFSAALYVGHIQCDY